MKTLITYNDCQTDLQYCIIDGDYSHLRGVMINSGHNVELEKEASNLLFDNDSGEFLLSFSNDVSIVENKNWDKVVIVTFLP